jgi:hypothetical protein
MPQQRQRKVIPAEEMRLSQEILDDVESINGWHDFSKIEHLTLINHLQISSHADAYHKARALSGLEPITQKDAMDRFDARYPLEA